MKINNVNEYKYTYIHLYISKNSTFSYFSYTRYSSYRDQHLVNRYLRSALLWKVAVSVERRVVNWQECSIWERR